MEVRWMKRDTKLILGLVSAVIIVVGVLCLLRTPSPAYGKGDGVYFYEGSQSETIRLESFGAQYWRIDYYYTIPENDWQNAFFMINTDGGVLKRSDPPLFPPRMSWGGTLIVERFEGIEIRISSNVKWQIWVSEM